MLGVTLIAPINIVMYPLEEGDIPNKDYREADFRYIDIPLGSRPKIDKVFDVPMKKAVDIHLIAPNGNGSFVPTTNIASIDIRSSYPNHKYYRRQARYKDIKSFIRIYGQFLVLLGILTTIFVNMIRLGG